MHRSSSTSNLKKAVLLVGSGYGALKVAQDLSQSGLPLVWVTKAIHFLEHPRGAAPFTDYPEDLDFQFRPLYLQVTRHPLKIPYMWTTTCAPDAAAVWMCVPFRIRVILPCEEHRPIALPVRLIWISASPHLAG